MGSYSRGDHPPAACARARAARIPTSSTSFIPAHSWVRAFLYMYYEVQYRG